LRPFFQAARAGAFLVLASLAGCASVSQAPAPSEATPEANVPPASPTPAAAAGNRRAPAAAAAVPVPKDAAPSGTLMRIGLKSDLPEFVFGPPGERWIVASAGRAEVLRGPLRFRPDGAAAAGFTVQAGAFSQEAPARERADRLSARFQAPGTVAFSADRGVYRVLLGAFADRPSAEALAEKIRAAGEEAAAVEGRAAAPAAAAAFLAVTVEDGSARRLAAPASRSTRAASSTSSTA
jgi:hypothetical protein